MNCTGDREFRVIGKDKDEKVRLNKVAGEVIELVVQECNRYKE